MAPMSGEALTALCQEAAAALESVAERFRERRSPENDRRSGHRGQLAEVINREADLLEALHPHGDPLRDTQHIEHLRSMARRALKLAARS